MEAKQLFDTLDEIEKTKSKKSKAIILESIKNSSLNDIACKYFSNTYDWFRIYNVGEKAIPDFTPGDDVQSADFYWNAFVNIIYEIENKEHKPNRQKIRDFIGSIKDQQSYKWIVASILKKPRIGISEKTINKIWPKLINFFEVQLADTLNNSSEVIFKTDDVDDKKKKYARDYYYLEPKIDGIRAICIVSPKENKVSFFSRGGQVLNNTAPAGINEYLLNCCNQDIVFDGELYATNWNETSKVTSKDEGEADPEQLKNLKFFVFDMLTKDEWDHQLSKRTYCERREVIPFGIMGKTNDKVIKTISKAFESREELDILYRKYLDEKYEGVMVKDPYGLYEFKRTNAWLKYKPFFSDEFEIIGKYAGEKRSENEHRLGGLIIKINDSTCEVGSGFSGLERDEFWINPPIGQIAEIEYKEKTEASLREPVFVRLRKDKSNE